MDKHVAIWLDHQEAHIFHIHRDNFDEATVKAPQHIHHRHPKGLEGGKEHPDDTKRFFREVAHSLEAAEEILIVGPSTAKLEFLRYVHKHDQALEPRIIGIETVDHPSDGQLVAYAKKYFKRIDQMR
jgi:stalled ribosome rescue protein Dom34